MTPASGLGVVIAVAVESIRRASHSGIALSWLSHGVASHYHMGAVRRVSTEVYRVFILTRCCRTWGMHALSVGVGALIALLPLGPFGWRP